MKPANTDARFLLTGEQCKAGRELLGLSREGLAGKAGVLSQTILYFEGGRPAGFPTQAKIRTALERAGVEFPSAGTGVRLRTTEG